MKKLNWCLLIAMTLGVHVEAHSPNNESIPNPMNTSVSTPRNLEYDEIDPTDALAVPSDSSNLDIDIEMKQLEQASQRNQQKKINSR
jgi:hypothetical protein